MIFPSYVFLLLYLPLALAGWHLLSGRRLRLAFLVVSSYIFYGWWDPRFTVLMALSTALDFHCGRKIFQAEEDRSRRRWLALAVAGNLLSLAFFKYADFALQSIGGLLRALGVDMAIPVLGFTLPLGISFYTFQSMSYSIDIYRGVCRPVADWLQFAAYVSMFPQLVAGPIVRYRDLATQLDTVPDQYIDFERVASGLWLFVIGMMKKVMIADRLAPVVHQAFDVGMDLNVWSSWVGVLAYSFQLYFDFSGYSDMARGLGRFMGLEFPVNFNSPYKARNISDFWRRWHISLSEWLRDYLFIPLGGSRCGRWRTFRNLAVTMFLGGLWHGAGWNFVLWGLLHGAYLVAHAAFARNGRELPALPARVLTFLAVTFGWVLFRAPDFGTARELATQMLFLGDIPTLSGAALNQVLSGAGTWSKAMCILAPVLAFGFPNSDELPTPRSPLWGGALAALLLLVLSLLRIEAPFLYFRF